MNLEQNLARCEYNLKQIKYFNPDPYYVNYFLKEFIKSVIDVYNGIIQEAGRNFGFFITSCTIQKFENKALEKKDQSALKFLSWYNENHKIEHDASYPKFIDELISSYKEIRNLPKISVKLIALPRYEDDCFQKISIPLKNGKIKSKQEVHTEIKRQTSVFLEIINKKRKIRNEPIVSKNQVIASTFLESVDCENKEIPYSCEIYLPVLKRFLEKSMIQIKKLTQWKE